MTDSDFERLFWEERDGPPSVVRHRRIEELLSRQPDARRQLEALEHLAASLDALDDLDPPPELRKGVRRAIASRPAHGVSSSFFSGWSAGRLGSGWRPRLAWAAMGTLIGILGYHLIAGGLSPVTKGDHSRLAGALNVRGTEPSVMVLDEDSGTLRLVRTGSNIIATLRPNAGLALALTVRHEGGELDLLRVEGIEGSRHEIDLGQDEVRVLADGPVTLVLVPTAGGPQTLTVGVATAGGTRVLERRVDLSGLDNGD